MNTKLKYIVILFFFLLLSLIITTETIWRVCSVCGVQDFERYLFGKKVEWLSTREVDEFGSYAQWKEKHKTICTHQWILIDEFSSEVQEHLNKLK
ncbi:hypothetical protein EGM88_01375 [Aureibaculum marinum]|uniref:Uncharacterized protein n=1 Tax=Aureibaculum marinum TaxID=2487930 RepID=A0A3N4NVU1_9FLAO|nr:hypothetical protein [Aureibaculum marinum]RPD99945.1 hypothetical protein EGM88_01375 [Aureibaculum marinum]